MRMDKVKNSLIYLITFFCLLPGISLTSSSSYGQVSSGKVVYKVRTSDALRESIDTLDTKDDFRDWALDYFQKMERITPSLKFDLIFSQNEALFSRPDVMDIDDGTDINYGYIATGIEGVFYSNIAENKNIQTKKFNDHDWLIETPLNRLDWKILPDTKYIEGYKCFKATAVSEYLNDIKKDTPVTAWFCPDLPYQFGPMAIAGLPGIILELEYHHFVFYADEVNLKSGRQKIKRPDKGKVVDKDQYIEEIKNLSLKWREKIRNSR